MTRWLFLLTLAACTLQVGPIAADEPVQLRFEIEEYTLDNGLRVVLVPSERSPTVAISVYYDVGSRNEERGRSGFAHLFEHMMFQGSENIAKGEHFTHISANGGRMNGTTSEDRTNYYEILPSDRLALGLWLEADRMRSLDISAENFENQREVVKEERRLRVDNQPYVPAILDFNAAFYRSWEYSHSVIGSMDDLDAAELSDVQAFFDLYYAPNNAVLTIAGDFEPSQARELVAQHFGDIPRGNQPPEVVIVEPEQTDRQDLERTDALATQPMVIVSWHTPPAPDPEYDAIEIMGQILAGSESSRLYGRLVRQDEVALQVDVGTDAKRGPDAFWISAITQGQDPAVARDTILEEVARLARDGVTEDELAAAKQQFIRQVVSNVEGNLYLSLIVGHDALYYGEPDRINGAIERIQGVTTEAVQAVAQRYLTEANLNVMLIHVADEEEGGQ